MGSNKGKFSDILKIRDYISSGQILKDEKELFIRISKIKDSVKNKE